jgi:hypothetical protein
MNKLLAILVFLLGSSLADSAQVRTSLQTQSLQGTVKRLVSRTYHLGEGITRRLYRKLITEYNAAGFKTQETLYFDDDTSTGHNTKFTYDAEGHLTGKTGYSVNGSENARWDLKYSGHFHTLNMKEYDEKDKLQQEEVHKYDDDGKEKEMICYYGDVQEYKFTYVYDKAGNLITQNQSYIENFDGSDHPDKIIYTFKEDGTTLVMKSDHYTGSNSDREVSYEYNGYDKTGNWLSRTGKEHSKVHDIIERQIEYY